MKDTTYTIIGEKYNKDLELKDIAKIIRKEIKGMVKTGAIAPLKTSVTSNAYSGGQNIDVKIKAFEGTIENPRWTEWKERVGICRIPGNVDRYTPAADQALKALQELLKKYNKRVGDSFNGTYIRNFYADVRFTC